MHASLPDQIWQVDHVSLIWSYILWAYNEFAYFPIKSLTCCPSSGTAAAVKRCTTPIFTRYSELLSQHYSCRTKKMVLMCCLTKVAYQHDAIKLYVSQSVGILRLIMWLDEWGGTPDYKFPFLLRLISYT